MANRCSRLWSYKPPQKISSAGTSINAKKLPKVFTKATFVRGGKNADIGGGRFDNSTAALAKKGVRNYVFDPYNRTPAHNKKAAAQVCGHRADTVTVANVLNVIKEPRNRQHVLKQAADAVKPDGTVYILIYQGKKTGRGTATSAGWQENRKTASYVNEVRKVFSDVTIRKGLIEARNPRRR